MIKNNKKCQKKHMKTVSNIFLWTRPTDSCNMLKTLQRRRKYIGIILSDEHPLYMQMISLCEIKCFSKPFDSEFKVN